MYSNAKRVILLSERLILREEGGYVRVKSPVPRQWANTENRTAFGDLRSNNL